MFPFLLDYSTISYNIFQENPFKGLCPLEPKDDPRLLHCPYQTQFLKNFDSLKTEFKSKINHTISFVSLKKFLASPAESRRYLVKFAQSFIILISYISTIYNFLCALAFYELNNQKNYEEFVKLCPNLLFLKFFLIRIRKIGKISPKFSHQCPQTKSAIWLK